MRGEVVVYGIDNCDQVRRARAWLRGEGVAFRFHDFRADGLDATLLARWMGHLPWDALLNKRGLSWRHLDPARRASVVDQASASDWTMAGVRTRSGVVSSASRKCPPGGAHQVHTSR